MTRLLLIENDPGLVRTLGDRLRAEGYAVEHAGDGDAGFEAAASQPFDLVLLDVGLPGRDGFAVVRDLRQRGVRTPVLMLTARGQVTDRVVGLRLGADDYLVKPFDTAELLARIEALLRRSGRAAPGARRHRFGDVTVDEDRAEVRRGDALVELSAKEFGLLCHLLAHRGHVVTRDDALTHVWGYDATPTTRTVDVHIAGLRQKLEADASRPRHLVTVHGRGYKLAT
ncbi:response regulator transcription factor [Rubrivirga sp. IMCC45206]|uniref:response regulator transcription factor n=1 Tax=Rubrivirga sp. IMCC45206 TaxID=3391614 RepID=UPI00398FD0AE